MLDAPFAVHITSDYTNVHADLGRTTAIGKLFADDENLIEVTLRRRAPERPLGYLNITFARVDDV